MLLVHVYTSAPAHPRKFLVSTQQALCPIIAARPPPPKVRGAKSLQAGSGVRAALADGCVHLMVCGSSSAGRSSSSSSSSSSSDPGTRGKISLPPARIARARAWNSARARAQVDRTVWICIRIPYCCGVGSATAHCDTVWPEHYGFALRQRVQIVPALRGVPRS